MTVNFYAEINKNTVEALMNGVAFFMKPQEATLPFISDSLNGNPITGANYFNLMLANNLNGKHHTEYVKMNEALSSKPEWFSALHSGNRPMGALFQEESMGSNSRYSFVMPAAELNQTKYRDNQNNQPREHYIPFQSHNAKMSDFGEFVREQCSNAINASFTNCAFKSNIPAPALGQFKTMLINEIGKNPQFMAEVTNRAHQEVMDLHYQPFNRTSFIEKARNENSHEFQQLNSAINGHVGDMYINKKTSFNPEFNELSRPLLNNIENIYRGNPNPKPAIDNEITQFVREQIRHDRPAAVLADTCAGTYIEKAQKIERIGKIVVKGAALAGALFTSNFPAAVGIAGSLISDIMTKHKVPEHFPDQHNVVINNQVFKREELNKILNFDNAPFSITGKGTIGKLDYEFAHRAEKTILNMHPNINKDEYHQDMSRHQATNFYKSAAGKMDKGSHHDFIKVADNITALQELKGDNTLKGCRDNPRSFFACLNNTIRNNPQVLEQAVAQVKTVKNTISQVASMIRR